MPSLRDKALAGVLSTFSTRTSATAAWFARSSQLSSSRPGQAVRSVMQGRRHGPSIATVGHSPPTSQAGLRVGSSLYPSASLGKKSPPVEEVEIAIISVLVDVRMGRWSHFQTTAKNVVFFSNLTPCLSLCPQEVG
jgi:hypothetical protein